MKREFFLTTDRVGFSKWKEEDIHLAKLLWGNPGVTRFICAGGRFSDDDMKMRLRQELRNEAEYHVQYWPFFSLHSDKFIGCCGLRPRKESTYEIGFHLLPEFWGQGYAREAAGAVITYAFVTLKASGLFAGHHPDNEASAKLLSKLGFRYIGEEFYAPTGLYHPSYELKRSEYKGGENSKKLERNACTAYNSAID